MSLRTRLPNPLAALDDRALWVPREYEEHRLERVFREVPVANGPTAHPEHQPAVPLHQLLERRLVALPGEARQQRAVVQRGERVR